MAFYPEERFPPGPRWPRWPKLSAVRSLFAKMHLKAQLGEDALQRCIHIHSCSPGQFTWIKKTGIRKKEMIR